MALSPTILIVYLVGILGHKVHLLLSHLLGRGGGLLLSIVVIIVNMKPVFFANSALFRKWLEAHHQTETELLVGFYKVNSNKPSMTWSESVDQALCFGWIDGVRKGINEDSYSIRFTPRKSTSIWSAVNTEKIKALTEQGLMQPAGLRAFEQRKVEKSRVYSFESEARQLSDELVTLFRANQEAWEFYIHQAPSYQKTNNYWIMTAKQEKTRLDRLRKTIAASSLKKRLR